SLVARRAVPRSECARGSPSSMRARSSYWTIASLVRPVINSAVPRFPWRAARELADCLVGMTRGEPGDAELRVSFGLVGQERRPALHRIDGGGGVAEEELCATQLDERSAEAGSLLRDVGQVPRRRKDRRIAFGRRIVECHVLPCNANARETDSGATLRAPRPGRRPLAEAP